MFKLSPLSKMVKLSLVSGLALTAASTSAFAEEGDKVENVERIAVVGSRAAPRSVNDSPVPIDIIGGDELGRNGATDMLDMLASTVPSFNVRAQPISDAATLIRPVNLRGLPSDSTLLLLNGKRRHRASVIAFQGGGVNDGAQGPDISVIPSVALQQVEVLRDGAAAQYGSDAIAGVMNFVLKDDSEGGSISVKTGEYYEGDGAATIIDGNIGLPLTENGFINASFQLKNADATSRSVQRPDAAAIKAAGNTSIEDPAQIWGNPEIKDDYTIFVNSGIDLDENTKVYAFGNVSSRDVTGGFYYRNPHNRGNVFSVDGGETLLVGAVNGDQSSCATVPANVGNVLSTPEYAAMLADPNCFSMNQLKPGGYTPLFGGSIEDMSFAAGVKGEMSGWMYDVSAVMGNNKATFNLKNSLNPSLGLASPTDFETGAYEQSETTVGLDLVKAIDFGMANLVNVATGLEWREESFEITAGEESSWVAGPYADQGFNIGSHGFKGFGPESAGKNSRNNIAAYLDLETFVNDNFLLGTALRYEDFSTFGSTLDYKVTAQYQLNEEFSVRGSHSTGFRAPTVGQANVVNTQTSIVGGDLIQTFIAPPTNPLAAFYGGKELTPEESTSFAFGGVYDNDGLLITVDYYTIEVTGRLAQSSQISVEAEDYTALEAAGVQNPELISAVTYYSNDFDTTTQGIDLVANYETEFMGADTMVSLAYNWTDTNVDKFNPATTNEGKVRRLEDGIPAHRATLTFAPSWDKVNLTVRGNFYGEYYATHADDTSEWGSEVAGAAMTLDAEVSYSVTDSLILSVGANNLFDQEAEKLKDSYAELGGVYYESGPFDYNGGYYYMKAQYKF
ncbi:TonB-dependent siderophore receptor [Psychrosphaera sp. F3M07]|uniref:TonB-dependent receptor plug domain-containing protein n=1 Tax=Psychrosphaera sp. F3M07 TaxID=2841560 RepID=UPI002091AA52|nr:TonB-dependent receptor [Psychrosphaera sp. F3M07]